MFEGGEAAYIEFVRPVKKIELNIDIFMKKSFNL